MITRRLALFRILAGSTAAAAATTATVAAVTPTEAKEHTGPFEHPAEYLAAMQAIGWSPVALFQRMESGPLLRLGVSERAGGRDHIEKTWTKKHAISMRCPVQLPMDVHPDQDWWKAVWEYLYDKGLRQDVTPPRAESREGGEA